MSNISYPKYKLPNDISVDTVSGSTGISASYLYGDGSNLTNLPQQDLSGYATLTGVSGTFVSQSSLNEQLNNYATLTGVSGTFVSQSQLNNYATLTGVSGTFVTNQAATASLAFLTASNTFSQKQIINNSLEQGYENVAIGAYSHAEGENTEASETSAHSEGRGTSAVKEGSHSEGNYTVASGAYSHVEGDNTLTYGFGSHAEGYGSIASSSYAHAEGSNTQALGVASHTEGYNTIASGAFSHAEGKETIADGENSHAEGFETQAIGITSHAEGELTEARGIASHAEGYNSIAYGDFAHAEGQRTLALGNGSHTEGLQTTASADYQHVQGLWNQTSSTALALIGNGTSEITRSNIFEVYNNYINISGALNVTNGISGSGQNLTYLPTDIDHVIHVAMDGDDNNDGTLTDPFLTIQEAINYASSSYPDFNESVVIEVGPGSYVESIVIDRHNTYIKSKHNRQEQRATSIFGTTTVNCSTANQKFNQVVGFEGIFFDNNTASPTFAISGSGQHLTYLKHCYIASNNTSADANPIKVFDSCTTASTKLVLENCTLLGQKGGPVLMNVSGGDIKVDSTEFYYSSAVSASTGAGISITGNSLFTADRIIVDIASRVTGSAVINNSSLTLSTPTCYVTNASLNSNIASSAVSTYKGIYLWNVILPTNYTINANNAGAVVYGNITTALAPTSYTGILSPSLQLIPLYENHGRVYATSVSASNGMTGSFSGSGAGLTNVPISGLAGGILSGSYPNPSGLQGFNSNTITIQKSGSGSQFVALSGAVDTSLRLRSGAPSTVGISPGIELVSSERYAAGSSGGDIGLYSANNIVLNAKNGKTRISSGDNVLTSTGLIELEVAPSSYDPTGVGPINIGANSKISTLDINIGTSNFDGSGSLGTIKARQIKLGSPTVVLSSEGKDFRRSEIIIPNGSTINVRTPTVNLVPSSNITMSGNPAIDALDALDTYSPNGCRVTLINTSQYSICFLNDPTLSPDSSPWGGSGNPVTTSLLKLGAESRIVNPWGVLELQFQRSGSATNSRGFWVETNFSNNLTGSYDLSNYAVKNSSNTFTANQTITGSLYAQNSVSASSLTGTGAYINYLDFNTTATQPSAQLGRLFYNTTNGDISTYLTTDGLYLNNGQQLVQKCHNNTGSPIAKGKIVHISGSNTNSDTPWIALADWSNDNLSANTLGVTIESIANASEGYVIVQGVVNNIDLSHLTGRVNGQVLFLSSSGAITNVKPLAPQHNVSIGQIVAKSDVGTGQNTTIYVSIQNGYELSELHDVSASNGKANGDLLVWDSGNSVWKNTKELSGSYGVTGSLNVTNAISASQITGAFTGSFSGIVTSATLTGEAGGILSGSYPTPEAIQTTGGILYVKEGLGSELLSNLSIQFDIGDKDLDIIGSNDGTYPSYLTIKGGICTDPSSGENGGHVFVEAGSGAYEGGIAKIEGGRGQSVGGAASLVGGYSPNGVGGNVYIGAGIGGIINGEINIENENTRIKLLENSIQLSGSTNITGSLTISDILKAPLATKVTNSAGSAGQICWDTNYIYVCTAVNTWKSSSLA